MTTTREEKSTETRRSRGGRESGAIEAKKETSTIRA